MGKRHTPTLLCDIHITRHHEQCEAPYTPLPFPLLSISPCTSEYAPESDISPRGSLDPSSTPQRILSHPQSTPSLSLHTPRDPCLTFLSHPLHRIPAPHQVHPSPLTHHFAPLSHPPTNLARPLSRQWHDRFPFPQSHSAREKEKAESWETATWQDHSDTGNLARPTPSSSSVGEDDISPQGPTRGPSGACRVALLPYGSG